MDSTEETEKHIHQVQDLIFKVRQNMLLRSHAHDASKLLTPEKEVFDEYTEKLKGLTYNSPEYKECLAKMKPALDHHYSNNRHHPEYHKEGIMGMSLLDIIEMLCDWKAASMRHTDGNVFNSIEINQKRFGYSDELKQIFINTAKELGF